MESLCQLEPISAVEQNGVTSIVTRKTSEEKIQTAFYVEETHSTAKKKASEVDILSGI